MYHSIAHSDVADALTVKPQDFEKQIRSFKKEGYSFIALPELLNSHKPSNQYEKTIALTFDDGYTDNYELAYPILKAYDIPATIFLPTAYLGDTSRWDQDNAKSIMSVDLLQSFDPQLISFALHTHRHINYEKESMDDIGKDLELNIHTMRQHNLPFLPALAYPFGKRPKDPSVKKRLFSLMKDLGIQFGFRIGNRINKNVHQHPYEIQRLDVRGTDTHAVIMRKIRFGKLF